MTAYALLTHFHTAEMQAALAHVGVLVPLHHWLRRRA